MLPWVKDSTAEILAGMMTFEWPCPAPRYVALMEARAIIAAGCATAWSHEKLATRWKRSVRWVREVRAAANDQQMISQCADDDQQMIRLPSHQRQVRSRHGASSSSTRGRSPSQKRSADSTRLRQPPARASEGSKRDVDREEDREKKDPPSPSSGDTAVAVESDGAPYREKVISARARRPAEQEDFVALLVERKGATEPAAWSAMGKAIQNHAAGRVTAALRYVLERQPDEPISYLRKLLADGFGARDGPTNGQNETGKPLRVVQHDYEKSPQDCAKAGCMWCRAHMNELCGAELKGRMMYPEAGWVRLTWQEHSGVDTHHPKFRWS